MPARGKTYKTGKRDLVFTKKFYKDFIKETKIDIDYHTFRTIILESNKEIASIVSDSEDGFKLPENLGYVVVTKYKTKKKPIDWVNTLRLKKTVLLPNLHSFGYIYHIKWFKRGLTQFAFKNAYRLEPARLLKRNVAKNGKNGMEYEKWEANDFWSNSKKLNKLYTKD